MRYFIISKLRIYHRITKNMFSIGKCMILKHWGFCKYRRTFSLRKDPEYLYRLFYVLPKQIIHEMKVLKVEVYIQQ